MDTFKEYLGLLVLLGLYLYIGVSGIIRILKQGKSSLEKKKSIRNVISIGLAFVGYIVLFITFILWRILMVFSRNLDSDIYVVIMFCSLLVAVLGIGISPNKYY